MKQHETIVHYESEYYYIIEFFYSNFVIYRTIGMEPKQVSYKHSFFFR